MKNDLRENRIVLMVKNPHWAYSYWEIKKKMFVTNCISKRNQNNRNKKILRIYEIEKMSDFFDRYNFSKDEDIHGDGKEWYFHLGNKNVRFFIEIGLKEDSGRFLPLARSNCVTTATDELSQNREEKWVIPENDEILKEIKEAKDIENVLQINKNNSNCFEKKIDLNSNFYSLMKKHIDDNPLSSNSSENFYLKKMSPNIKRATL